MYIFENILTSTNNNCPQLIISGNLQTFSMYICQHSVHVFCHLYLLLPVRASNIDLSKAVRTSETFSPSTNKVDTSNTFSAKGVGRSEQPAPLYESITIIPRKSQALLWRIIGKYYFLVHKSNTKIALWQIFYSHH